MLIDIIDLDLKNTIFNIRKDPTRYLRGNQIFQAREVQIQSVEAESKEITLPNQATEYRIQARVKGTSRSYYHVELKVKQDKVMAYHCDCLDFLPERPCKHVIATFLEAQSPHNATTSDGMMRLFEQRRKQNIIAIQQEAEMQARQEELRKKTLELRKQRMEEEKRKRQQREYVTKYKDALHILNAFNEDRSMITNDWNQELNVVGIYKKVQDLKEYADTFYANSELATNIKIQPIIELCYSTLQLKFKIGVSTMYVLKDIIAFSEAFQTGELLNFGKKLKFYAKIENFSEESRSLLQYILNYAKSLKRVAAVHPYYSTAEIEISEEELDEVFSLLKGREISLEIDNWNIKRTTTLQFTEEEFQIQLFLEKINSSEFRLKDNLKDCSYFLGKQYLYILKECQKLYQLDLKENKNVLEIVKELSNSSSGVRIPKDKIEEFSTYVFPKIEKNLKILCDTEHECKEGVLVNKLATKLFLDLNETNDIILTVKFCYGDNEFNILAPNLNGYISEKKIARNISEEKKVLTRIFEDGFELVPQKEWFLLRKTEDVYEFLVHKIEGYMNDFEVLATENFKKKEIKRPKIFNVGIRMNNGLLELDLSKMNMDTEEIKTVLQSYSIKKKYYKLKNGDLLSLEKNSDLDFLLDVTENLEIDYKKMEKGYVKLPISRGLYLERLLSKHQELSATKNIEFNQMIDKIANKNHNIEYEGKDCFEFSLSEKFDKILRSYQKVGFQWLKGLEQYHFGGILADDMGLGKTLQIIALLANYKEEYRVFEESLSEDSPFEQRNQKHRTSIVVCPSSLLLNWKAEIEKWCPDIETLLINGTAEVRKEKIESYLNYDLLITSYDLLKRDVEEYKEKTFQYIIADEAQYIKNSATQNATALKSLEGIMKFALTGTPIENSIAELWSIFDFIMPGYLYSYAKFKKRFEEPILKENDSKTLAKLKSLIEPFVLRRVKKEVLTELPEKNITIMKNEMTKEQEKLYISYLAQVKQEVAQEIRQNDFEKSKLKILMLLTRLRQICCHPSLFIENYYGNSGKLEQCMDIVREAVSAGHRILLFSQYTSMLQIIEEEFEKQNIEYYKLVGNTKVDKRIEMVEDFNKNEKIKVFLISLKAGGTGLNLTGADVVIHYDPWWNLSSENQATDRAYRIGQKNSVQVYKLITTNSIEEKINQLQEKKAMLSEQLLSTEETFIHKLSKDEIMALFE